MLLVIDIGNTNIVLGTFEADALQHSWRISTRRDQTADEYAMLCRSLFDSGHLFVSRLEGVVISSVVPPLNEAFEALSRKYFGMTPYFVRPEAQPLIRIRYRPVSDVGADRIVTAVAALELAPPPLVVVDFGTATTFDVVSSEGEYVGGLIAPGAGISAEALVVRASRLPRIELRKPSQLIGDSTVGSMQSGIYFGYVGLVEGILARLKAELPGVTVIATGGFAHTIAPDVPAISRVEENLMLYGLKMFYQKLFKSS